MNMVAFLKQDSQCTYNVPLRQICATTDAGKKQSVLHILRAYFEP